MFSEYEVGDRVVAIKRIDGLDLTGREGTVLFVDFGCMGIEFDKQFVDGHNCGGRGKDGYCRYCYHPQEIEHVEVDDTPFEESEELNAFICGFGGRI